MAKKADNNTEEKVRLALDEHKWINTPVIYTTHGSSFTRFQQDVMLQVSGKLQDHFTKYLEDGRYRDKERPKSAIAKEDLAKGLAPLRLEMKNLNVGDSHYGDVSKMLDALTKLYVYAPVFDKETGLRKGMDYMPIFSKIFIPESFTTKEGEDYAYKVCDDGNPIASSRRDGYVDVTINTEVAAYAFDMDQGYFNHLERIALFCNSAFTSRLYLLLMKYVSRGQMHPAIDYFELKDFLGMYDRKEKSSEIIREKYEKFSQFRKQVLDVARRDMERLCDENKIEIMLACTEGCKEGYEPLYRGTAKRGNPEKIKFHIKRTPLGVARELELHRGSSEQRLCDKLLELYPTLDEIRLRQFVADVPEDLWNDFKKYAYNGVPKAVEKPHRWNGTHEDFVFYIMDQWVKQHKPPTPQQELQFDYGEDEPHEADGEKDWQEFLAAYNGDFKDIINGFKFHNLDRDAHILTLRTTKAFVSTFEAVKKEKTSESTIELYRLIRQFFGDDIRITYYFD